MRVTVCVCWALAMAMFIPQANAIVPLTTPIQGVLRDGAGVPVADAHFGMTFTLYTGAGAEAEAVWSEAWPPGGGNCLVDHTGCIHVTGGRFRVRLGLLNPLEPEVFSVGPLWLGIQVESEPELPRRPLGTSPYAYQAAVAGGLDCTGCVDLEALSGEAQSALIDETLAAVTAEGYATGDQVQDLAEDLAEVVGAVETLAPIGEHLSVIDGVLNTSTGLDVAGTILSTGNVVADGAVDAGGGVRIGSANPPPCDAEHAGTMHYDPQVQRLVFCDGQKLLQLRACEALCPDPASAPCGEGLIDGCGGACAGTGTGLSTALCISEQAATPCGAPVLDTCGNPCGSAGTGPEPSGCPLESDVACGQPVLDACGHPCGSSGTALDVGQCPAPGDVPCDTTPLDPCGNTCPGQVVPCIEPFDTVTFSTCGQSGSSGPTQSACNQHYAETSLEGDVTVVAGIQRWTVPQTATYRIRAVGASGGRATDYGTSFRGRGVTMEGNFLLNEGQLLSVLVGQEGEDGENIGGGGGGTFVVYDQTSTALVVAGGGGGACEDYNHRSGGPLGGGGTDATLSETGQAAPYEETSYPPGQGGTNGNGGGMTSGGCGTGGGGGLVSDGVTGNGSQGGKGFVNGGSGTTKSTADAGDGGFGGGSGGNNQCLTSAGAGGGYSGGGGGGHNAGGGGGGSYNNGDSQSNTGQTNLGHGQVVISLVE